MNYTWNAKKIKRDMTLAKLIHDQKALNYYKLLLSGLDTNQETFDKRELMLFDKCDELDYNTASKLFTTGLEYIPNDFYDVATDIFTWFEDTKSLYGEETYSHLELTDDELVTLCHDIIKSMNDEYLLKIFNILIKKENHLLNIQESNPNTKTTTDCVGGVTYYHPHKRKSHVNLFREHTIHDIEYLVHESLHFVYKYLLNSYYKENYMCLFGELEGEYANIYVARYLEQIGFKDTALLRKTHVNNVITASYLTMINHILFSTSKNQQFDVVAATEEVNKYLKYIHIYILESELPSYLTVSGFEEVTKILCYMTALELANDYEPSDALGKITSLKTSDTIDLFACLRRENIHFHDDGYKDFIKEYKITHKI